MATTNHTTNYNLSQYAASDPVKFLTNYNEDMLKIDQNAVPNTRKIAGVNLQDDILLSELISAGLAQGTGGAANNALSLGGVLAANYVQNASSANTNLTKINGWEGGNIRLSIFGKVVIVGAYSGALTGTQNTFIAMLPTTVKARIGWLDAGNGIVIRDSSDDNWGIYGTMATIPSGTYAVFVMQ